MKLFTKISLIILTTIVLLNASSNSKFKYKHKSKYKQVVLRRPVFENSVVSPVVEADELPGHTAINVSTPATRMAQFGEWNVPMKVEQVLPNTSILESLPVSSSSNNIQDNNIQFSTFNTHGLNLNDLGINHVDIQGGTNIENANKQIGENQSKNIPKITDTKTLLNKGNAFLHSGNIDKALEYYAAALKNASPDEEDQILNIIAKNLQSAPNDLAKKLEKIIDDGEDNKKQLINKIKLMLQKTSTNTSKHNEIVKNKKNSGDFSDHEIITLEPKKRILKLDQEDNSVKKAKENLKNDKPLKDLLSWAKTQKLDLNKIKVGSQNQKNEYNVIAVEKIKKKDKILQIPNKFVISTKHPSLKQLCNKISKISYFKTNYDKICIAVFLLTSKDNNLKPFINFIHDDTNYESFPFFYNKKQLKLLEGSYFSSLIATREEAMNFEYKILKEDKVLPENISTQEYLKSRVNVLSKNFSVKDSSDQTLSIMLPFANLFNHSSDKENIKLVKGKDGITIEATETIRKNDAMKLYFGNFSNYHYLLYYGFVAEHNSIPIQISLDLKIKNELSHKKYEEVLLSPDMKINSTLKKFRIIVSKLNAQQKLKNFNNPVSLENESESLRLLKIGLKTQIMRYPTPIDQDKLKLQSSSADKNTFNILTVLIEEKKMIIKYFDAALIFYKMLKKVIENGNEPLLLTKKISNLISRKKYMRVYFKLLVKTFNLKIQINEGQEDGDGLDISDNDLQEDYSDSNSETSDQQLDSEDLNNKSHNNDSTIENALENPSEIQSEPQTEKLEDSKSERSGLPNAEEPEEEEVTKQK